MNELKILRKKLFNLRLQQKINNMSGKEQTEVLTKIEKTKKEIAKQIIINQENIKYETNKKGGLK